MKTKRCTKNKIKLRKGEYQRKNKTFEYRWNDINGKTHCVYAKSLSELRDKEDAITRDILDGIDYSKLDSTIDSYFELWKKIKTGIRETTYATYVSFYERYIAPEYGKTRIKDVTYSSVALFLKGLAVNKGLKYASIRNIELSLSMVLDIAVKDDVLRSNPCKGVLRDLQREYANDSKVVRALTLQEQKALEAYIAKPGKYHQYYPIITVMLWTGMRVGEVLGLRWEDIDFENDEISVNHTLLFYSKGKGKGSDYKINPPKTKSSNRIVPMLPKVKKALLYEKRKQNLLGISCQMEIEGYTNFIFLNNKGMVLDYKKLNHKLDLICNEISDEIHKEDPTAPDFPHVHNHMLRHTFATRMREAGADIKATSEMMGHEGILITLKTYTDASREFKNREIAMLQDYYEKAN